MQARRVILAALSCAALVGLSPSTRAADGQRVLGSSAQQPPQPSTAEVVVGECPPRTVTISVPIEVPGTPPIPPGPRRYGGMYEVPIAAPVEFERPAGPLFGGLAYPYPPFTGGYWPFGYGNFAVGNGYLPFGYYGGPYLPAFYGNPAFYRGPFGGYAPYGSPWYGNPGSTIYGGGPFQW